VYLDEIFLKKTETYMKFWSIFNRYLTVVPRIAATHSDLLCYFCMIFSMMINAGLISIVYPFAVFGYAILQENRPSFRFWKTMLYYTSFIIILKLVA
jgi:hypothetical protein